MKKNALMAMVTLLFGFNTSALSRPVVDNQLRMPWIYNSLFLSDVTFEDWYQGFTTFHDKDKSSVANYLMDLAHNEIQDNDNLDSLINFQSSPLQFYGQVPVTYFDSLASNRQAKAIENCVGQDCLLFSPVSNSLLAICLLCIGVSLRKKSQCHGSKARQLPENKVEKPLNQQFESVCKVLFKVQSSTR